MVILIIKNNNIGSLNGPKADLMKIYKAYSINHPQKFFIAKYMPRGWDGKINYIKPNGTFAVGLIQHIGNTCDQLGIKWDICDFRPEVPKAKKITKWGDWELRDYQLAAVKSVVTNKIKGVRWPRSIIKVATNGGKTSISSFIYLCYNLPTVFLMNSKELFDQALEEIPRIIQQPVGQISSKKIEWAPFMICMVATTRNRVKERAILEKLSQYRCLIVDECDLANNKTNKKVIESLYNTQVRVGLSGTTHVSEKFKKDLHKNLPLEGFFGALQYSITNRALIDKGVSSEVEVTILPGNDMDTFKGEMDWQSEYEANIVFNSKRNKKVITRSIHHWKQGRTNQLIIAQRHKHIEQLLKVINKAIKAGAYPTKPTVDWVHHSRKDRKEVVTAFKEGKVDILIGSMILKRGKNFPKMKYMINAGAGKSPENTLQLLGRAFRGCKHYEDFHDLGYHLKSHSRKREIYYKNEKLTVLKKY